MSAVHGEEIRRVESACPLDCPDACSLDVSVAGGRVVAVGRLDEEPRHQRLHMREGAPLPGAHVRSGAHAPSRDSNGPQGRRRVPKGVVGRGARSRRREDEVGSGPAGRRGDPPRLVRRLERLSVAGHLRRAALLPPRRLPPAPDRLRGAVVAGGFGPVRQDARGRVSGLRPREPRRRLGDERVGLRHPPGAVHPAGAEKRSAPGRHRPSAHPPGRERRPAPGASSRHRSAGRARGDPVALRIGSSGSEVSRRSGARRRGARAPGPPLDARPCRRGVAACRPARSRDSRGSTPRRARPRCGAVGVPSATATGDPRSPRSSPCRPWPENSACAGADTRSRIRAPGGKSTGWRRPRLRSLRRGRST